MSELPSVERVEQVRRSVVMLPPHAPALDREKAIFVYQDLIAALLEVERLRGFSFGIGPRPEVLDLSVPVRSGVGSAAVSTSPPQRHTDESKSGKTATCANRDGDRSCGGR